MTRSFPKIPEEVRSLPKTSEVFQRRPKSEFPSPSFRTRINPSSLPLLLTSKIRDREGGIVIYSFYTWFSFLTWVWVNIFLEIGSTKTAKTHIFQSGVRNWPASVSRREIKVFDPQVWDSRLRRESWQVYTCNIGYNKSDSCWMSESGPHIPGIKGGITGTSSSVMLDIVRFFHSQPSGCVCVFFFAD